MFDLMSPCANCPFKKGHGDRFRLTLGALREIMTAPAFQCHKTVDYEKMNGEYDHSPRRASDPIPQQCAGLMAVLNRMDRPNQIMQIASRLGEIDLSKLDPRGEAYENFTEVLIAHGHGGCHDEA